MTSAAVTWRIREATAADARAIARLGLRETCRHIREDCTAEGYRLLLRSLVTRNVAERMAGDFRYWVVEENGALAGFAALRKPGHLYHLFVDSTQHGRGLGRGLLQKVRDAVADDTLTVNASSFARAFYLRQGFLPAGDAWIANGVRSWPMTLSRVS